eukprot:7544801-Pyramimonas_sp.AAC.1
MGRAPGRRIGRRRGALARRTPSGTSRGSVVLALGVRPDRQRVPVQERGHGAVKPKLLHVHVQRVVVVRRVRALGP